jgi:hypothetical protein
MKKEGRRTQGDTSIMTKLKKKHKESTSTTGLGAKDTDYEKDKRHVEEFSLLLDKLAKRGVIV